MKMGRSEDQPKLIERIDGDVQCRCNKCRSYEVPFFHLVPVHTVDKD
jgi:hypothetical protein